MTIMEKRRRRNTMMISHFWASVFMLAISLITISNNSLFITIVKAQQSPRQATTTRVVAADDVTTDEDPFITIHKDDIQKECQICQDETDCGGLTFRRNLDNPSDFVDRTRHLFLSPSLHPKTRTLKDLKDETNNNDDSATDSDDDLDLLTPFVSTKRWLVHRGLIMDANYEHVDFDGSNFLHRMENVTIEEAREYCISHKDCIAFSIPLQRNDDHHGMTNLVDEAMFVRYITQMDYTIDEELGEEEYITHIIHDRTLLETKIHPEYVKVDEGKYEESSTSPYRPCCHTPDELPSLDEIRRIDTLERISCNITREKFFNKYEKPRIPVMLVDCDKEWPARTLWKDTATLLNRFSNDTVWDQISGVGDDVIWEDFYKYYHNKLVRKDKGYRIFAQLEHESVARELYKDYDVPKPFKDADLYSFIPNYERDYFPNGFGPMHWFLLGSRGTGTMPHMDPHRTDAWNTVISGHKWWVVYPNRPKVIEAMELKCYPECSTFFPHPNKANDDEVVSWYSSVGRHAHKTYYDQDHAIQILQGPGETLYVPYGMVHSVLNMDETVAITQNYGSYGNLREVWGEILLGGFDMDWKQLYYNVLSKEQRAFVREIMWPIDLDHLPNTIEECPGAYDDVAPAADDDYDDEEEDFMFMEEDDDDDDDDDDEENDDIDTTSPQCTAPRSAATGATSSVL